MLCLLLAGYITLVHYTTRWTELNGEVAREAWRKRGGVVLALWHSRLLMAHVAWPPRRKDVQQPYALISMSPDGQFIARAMEMVGVKVVRGSKAKAQKQKGGMSAMRDMLAHLKQGDCVAITPDGPRGPRMQSSIGAVRLAQMADAPMTLVAWSTTNRIIFNSWDRFMLPLPFGRGVIKWGGPITIPRDASAEQVEQIRAQLDRELMAITHDVDRITGAPIFPQGVPGEKRPKRKKKSDAQTSNNPGAQS